MNGNVLECYEEQSDRRQYAKTLEALESECKERAKDILGTLHHYSMKP
jgi:hypothetical protein